MTIIPTPDPANNTRKCIEEECSGNYLSELNVNAISSCVGILNQVQGETMFRWTIKIANCKYKSGCNGRINAVAINSARHNPFVVIYNNNRMRTEEEEQQQYCKTFICIFHMDVLNWNISMFCSLCCSAFCLQLQRVLLSILFYKLSYSIPDYRVHRSRPISQFTAVDSSFLLRPCPTMEVQVTSSTPFVGITDSWSSFIKSCGPRTQWDIILPASRSSFIPSFTKY